MQRNKKIAVIYGGLEGCEILSGILNPLYDCSWIPAGQGALQIVAEKRPELILLDCKIHGVECFEFCEMIRQNRATKNIPVIFLSTAVTVDEKIRALEGGASDFIYRPFHSQELLVRINARLARRVLDAEVKLSAGNLRIDVLSCRVFIDEAEIEVTRRQFAILKMLVANKNTLVTREECLREVWGHIHVKSRNMDSQLSQLKVKLEKFNGKIVSVPGSGYCLETDVED